MNIEDKIDKFLNEGKKDKEIIKKIKKVADSAKTFEQLGQAYQMSKQFDIQKFGDSPSNTITSSIIDRAEELKMEYERKGKDLPKGLEGTLDKDGEFSIKKLREWFEKNTRSKR